MFVRRTTVWLMALTLTPAGMALADGTCVRLIRGGETGSQPLAGTVEMQPLHPADPQGVALVLRPVVAPSLTVSRALDAQPVRPHLVEVQVVNTKVYLDPTKDYEHQGPPGTSLDRNHFIPRALVLYRNLQGNRVRMILPTERTPLAQTPGTLPQPRFILEKPDPGLSPQHPADPIPNVPQPPAQGNPRQVAGLSVPNAAN